MDERAALPAIGRLLALPAVAALTSEFGKGAVTEALRDAVARARGGEIGSQSDAIVAAAHVVLGNSARGTLVAVINATGVVLHTNLGRAPLGAEARAAVERAGSGYSSLEFDLETGDRGSRHVHAAARLRRLTGAEDALVANNAAAALTLSLAALAGRDAGRPASVVVSRGELVEIGGAFRIPEIVTAGGANLVEVGTTNRTRLDDYVRALDAAQGPTPVLLKVHRSNFAIVGFTEEVEVAALVAEARARTPSPAVVYDLGSGLMLTGASVGLPDEPDVPSAIAAGADVVVFSGDKLLGGPQAGIAVGRSAAIGAMRKHPLMRALRGGKLVLAALDATLAVYERGPDVARTLPTLRALVEPRASVAERARRLRSLLPSDTKSSVIDTIARVGAGSQPLAEIASAAVRLEVDDPDALAERLRRGTPVVVGRIEGGALLLDLRAVDDAEIDALATAVSAALSLALL